MTTPTIHVTPLTRSRSRQGIQVRADDGRTGWIHARQLPADARISEALLNNATARASGQRAAKPNLVTLQVLRTTDKGALVRGPDGREGWMPKKQLGPGNTVSRPLYARLMVGKPALAQALARTPWGLMASTNTHQRSA